MVRHELNICINCLISVLKKGDYLKCNNISLGYNLEQSICDKLHITRARLNFNMDKCFHID